MGPTRFCDRLGFVVLVVIMTVEQVNNLDLNELTKLNVDVLH